MNQKSKIKEAIRYIEECNWWLTIIRGIGNKPKAPIFDGWPDYRPSIEVVETYLSQHWDAGIGINLGGSKIIDVEADSDEGEAFLNDLCRGHDFPCWQSRRGKHRLFLLEEGDQFFKDDTTKIEFRTGRHQSVLPPSVINGVGYRWINDPFTVPVPSMPEGLRQFYEERRLKRTRTSSPTTAYDDYQFRDHFDYLLRNIDLLKHLKLAGLKFVVDVPDRNGNIPCFVPEKIRGYPDHRPSGLFNVKSGVLRDFADGKNYGFFRVMAALTGQDCQDLFRAYEKGIGKVHGRPHSRRINPPSIWTEERQSLDEARTNLNQYFDEQLNREAQPRTLHIIKGPPGLGKIYGLCGKFAEKNKRAIILTLENELADHHSNLLPQARRMPVLRKEGCILPEDYESTSRRGFQPSKGFPCNGCKIGVNNCQYLIKFGSLLSAEQLCCAAVYHTHADFYSSHGNSNRPIVVFDENCIDLLLEPIVTEIEDWQAWLQMISQSDENTDAIRSLIEWMARLQVEFLLQTPAEKVKFLPVEIPAELKRDVSSSRLETWLNKNADKYPKIQNLYRESVYLLSQPASHVLLERIEGEKHDTVRIRFRMKHSLPEDKEVFILDATANVDLIRAIAPDWDVKVWECPLIEQAGQIIQIMDYDLSRNRIRREVNSYEPDNPTWLPQVIDHILEQHGPAALISFKEVIDGRTDLISLLKNRDRITRLENFPCRGHTFDEKTLIVIGTPYKDEACVWELAMALWGKDQLPDSAYTRLLETNGDFISSNRRHEEDHLKPIQEFILSADLVQAIGRVRPLQNEGKVFVLSNAPIPDWKVEQRMASEMFDIKWHKRADAAENQKQYFRAASKLLQSGKFFGNKDICEKIEMSLRTGQDYWTEYKSTIKAPIEEQQGRIRLKVPAVLIF